MATRFEVVLQGDNPAQIRAAGEEALHEVERLESLLSLFRPESEIAHLNARAAFEPVQVSPEVFALLERAQQLSTETDGAFDITIAPLVRCWGFMSGVGTMPAAEALEQTRAQVGMSLVALNPKERTVRFLREGVMLDLGAIGKGYAVECMVASLREAGVSSGLIHGGTSTVYGLGTPRDGEKWLVAIDGPPQERAGNVNSTSPLATVSLENQALSVSAVWGKSFHEKGREYGHVLDPRTGYPVEGSLLAAVVLDSAAETDALSTALLILGPAGHERITKRCMTGKTLLVRQIGTELKVEPRNFEISEPFRTAHP